MNFLIKAYEWTLLKKFMLKELDSINNLQISYALSLQFGSKLIIFNKIFNKIGLFLNYAILYNSDSNFFSSLRNFNSFKLFQIKIKIIKPSFI